MDEHPTFSVWASVKHATRMYFAPIILVLRFITVTHQWPAVLLAIVIGTLSPMLVRAGIARELEIPLFGVLGAAFVVMLYSALHLFIRRVRVISYLQGLVDRNADRVLVAASELTSESSDNIRSAVDDHCEVLSYFERLAQTQFDEPNIAVLVGHDREFLEVVGRGQSIREHLYLAGLDVKSVENQDPHAARLKLRTVGLQLARLENVVRKEKYPSLSSQIIKIRRRWSSLPALFSGKVGIVGVPSAQSR